MSAENEKYKRMIDILRVSKPDLPDPQRTESEIIDKIKLEAQKTGMVSDLIESLFGWVYIGWVRRSLIGVAGLLLVVFIYQQASILNQVKNLNDKVVSIGNLQVSGFSSDYDRKLTFYKISTSLNRKSRIKISDAQIEELLNSYEDLQVRYKDLLRIIDENPELKKYIEKKLNEEDSKPEI